MRCQTRCLDTRSKNTPRLALITGASSGLGKALSLALAQKGIPLIVVARDPHAVRQLAQELPATTTLHRCDLRVADERAQLMALIQDRRPDLVINNAGFGFYGPILSHPLSRWQEMLSVNAQAVLELSIASAHTLQRHHQTGTILNISSAAAFFSYPTFCVYAATKAFVNRFSQGFDEEMKAYGIRILTACPGQIDTPFRSKAACHHPQQPDRATLPLATAVQLLLKQIETGRQMQIIDWKYHLAVRLGQLLPQRWVYSFLRQTLKNRFM